MLYTGDFVLRYYVWFSQIRSQLWERIDRVPLSTWAVHLQKMMMRCKISEKPDSFCVYANHK